MMNVTLRQCVRLFVALLAVAALSAHAPIISAPPPYASNRLHELSSLEQFRDAFNADRDRPRILLLLSPT
ncbi:MAG TPA: hypothetical protein VNN18_04430 [Candidatus Xenobia bacterium]|nr:hypothetical protein [Candidatus Xenobia bacterium]